MLRPSQASLKDDYEQWIVTAMEMVHGQETRDQFMTLLKTPSAGQMNGKGQVESLAGAVVLVIQKIDNASRGQQVEVEDSIKVLGASEISKQIYEVGEAAGLLNLDEDHQELALSFAVQNYVRGEVEAKRIDPAKLKAHFDKGLRALPPEEKEKAAASMARVSATGRKYSGGA